jgi:hypothetical protein
MSPRALPAGRSSGSGRGRRRRLRPRARRWLEDSSVRTEEAKRVVGASEPRARRPAGRRALLRDREPPSAAITAPVTPRASSEEERDDGLDGCSSGSRPDDDVAVTPCSTEELDGRHLCHGRQEAPATPSGVAPSATPRRRRRQRRFVRPFLAAVACPGKALRISATIASQSDCSSRETATAPPVRGRGTPRERPDDEPAVHSGTRRSRSRRRRRRKVDHRPAQLARVGGRCSIGIVASDFSSSSGRHGRGRSAQTAPSPAQRG